MSAKKVILLDDEPIVGERLQPALEKAGFQVESYTDSQQVVDRLARERFDVLVTDLKMRKPDGLEVMRFAKRQWPGIKVIIITGFATVETATEAMREGAVEFIAKPFKIRALRDLILRITADTEQSPPS
ncbi:MAG: response regulator [Deltaproteobacteria bacterium]|nr:MAG: response regulator [Deltaproteobacteria bacterium]